MMIIKVINVILISNLEEIIKIIFEYSNNAFCCLSIDNFSNLNNEIIFLKILRLVLIKCISLK